MKHDAKETMLDIIQGACVAVVFLVLYYCLSVIFSFNFEDGGIFIGLICGVCGMAVSIAAIHNAEKQH